MVAYAAQVQPAKPAQGSTASMLTFAVWIKSEKMKTAYRLYSWRGIMKEQINAKDIKSSSDARKLAPFVDKDKHPFLWVNWSKNKINTGKKTPPYFRQYPTARIKTGKRLINLNDEIEEKKKISESELHKKARTELADYLNKLILEEKDIKWAYSDNRISDFLISGNLLSEVKTIETHYKYKTPFGLEYEFDIALLGKKLNKERLLLGAIEIEHTHSFGFLKLMISKCLGFPMISVNVEDFTPDDIDENWCKNAISETSKNSDDGLRRNYIYLHNSLYPVYTNIPTTLRIDEKHQYVVFCKKDSFDQLVHVLKEYRRLLRIPHTDVLIQPFKINYEDEMSIRTANNEGSIAGADWRDFNDEKYIRITLKVPEEKKGENYLYHLILARILNTHFDTLVGYKYRKGLSNDDEENPIWISDFEEKKIVQKHLSEPVKYLIEHLEENGLIDKIIKNPAANNG